MTTASQEFQIFVKATGSLCNLNCRYCYYLEKSALYPERGSWRMAHDLLEHYVVEHIQACPTPTILFAWHGGEPTILGIEYFRRITALQRKHRPAGRRIMNGIQTNGTLLDEAWCRFLKQHGFFVGLSLDGPRELHDRYRLTKSHEPTHDRVMRSWRLLQRHRIPCDVLCVVHDQNVRHPLEVYRFYREIGADYLQFLPLVEREDGGVSPESVPAQAYGDFLSAIFHEWLTHDVRRMGVQIFEEAAKPILGMAHAMCQFRQTCGDVTVIEHNGDFYACDHFVDREHHLGNIREVSLVDMVDGPAQREFGRQKWDTLPRHCRACEVLSMCNGGCPKDRFLRTPEGEEGLNYLCAGLKRFFAYCRPYLQELASSRMPGQVVERIMDLVPHGRVQGASRPGRNDPCPCGSGKKYKQCCGRLAGR